MLGKSYDLRELGVQCSARYATKYILDPWQNGFQNHARSVLKLSSWVFDARMEKDCPQARGKEAGIDTCSS